MKTATIKKNQTLYDVALGHYGTCEAVDELVRLNPGLRNDPQALAARGIDTVNDPAFYLDVALQPGLQVAVDPDSPLRERLIVRELRTELTTYQQ